MQAAKWFTVIADQVTDVAYNEQLVLFCDTSTLALF